MKAIRVHAYGQPPQVDDVPEPEASGPDDVVVRIGGSGLCRTDLHIIDGWFADAIPVDLPVVLGHENAGWVHAVGPAVEHLAVGDPVICLPNMACQLPKRTLPQLHAGQPESPPPQRHARPVPSGLTRSPERWQGMHPGGDQPLKLPGYDDPSHPGRSGNCPNDPGASPERARGVRPPVLAPHVNPLRGDSGMPHVDCISAHRVWPVAG